MSDCATALSEETALRNSPRGTTRPLNTRRRARTRLSTMGPGVPESAITESTRNVAG